MISEVFQSSLQTVIGRIVISADDQFITKLEFNNDVEVGANPDIPEHLAESVRQVSAYFEHPETEFHLPLVPSPTNFQTEIRAALASIVCGKTATYEAMARKVNKQGASRAVGMALSRNPLLIIVPCHRVIGSNGSLTGFAGGLHRKRWLLTHERKRPLLAGLCDLNEEL
jgi:methylated-DNA-[protein]-cysteine S-methyltransferase